MEPYSASWHRLLRRLAPYHHTDPSTRSPTFCIPLPPPTAMQSDDPVSFLIQELLIPNRLPEPPPSSFLNLTCRMCGRFDPNGNSSPGFHSRGSFVRASMCSVGSEGCAPLCSTLLSRVRGLGDWCCVGDPDGNSSPGLSRVGRCAS